MSVAEEFLAGTSGRGWKRDPLEVVTELRARPEEMGALVIEAVKSGSRRAMAGLPWVADDDLDDVSTAAFAMLMWIASSIFLFPPIDAALNAGQEP